MKKGQFFVLGMIIALVTIVSLINAISVPYGLSVSTTENQRLSLEKYNSFKLYLESAINDIDESWTYFSIGNRIKFDVKNNCSIPREKPWALHFNMEDDADENSIRLINNGKELTSQVEWINSTTKEGKVYFYDTLSGSTKVYYLYYNTPSTYDNSTYKKPLYNNIDYSSNSTAVTVNTEYYSATVDLSKNGVISQITSRVSGKKLFENSFDLKDNILQSTGGTASLIESEYGPVMVMIKIRSDEFGVNDTRAETTYRFFKDRIEANITATYFSNSHKLEIFNKASCSDNYNVSVADGSVSSGWCSSGISLYGFDNKSYMAFYNENASYSMLADYSKWTGGYYYYNTTSSPSIANVTFGLNSTVGQQFYGNLIMVFYPPKSSDTFAEDEHKKYSCIEIITNDTSSSILNLLKENNEYIESESAKKGYASDLDETVHGIRSESKAMQDDWYSHKIYSQNISIAESLGYARTNYRVRINISSDSSTNPDLIIPITTNLYSIEVYLNEVAVNVTTTWNTESTRSGSVEFTANFSAWEEKNYEFKYY